MNKKFVAFLACVALMQSAYASARRIDDALKVSILEADTLITALSDDPHFNTKIPQDQEILEVNKRSPNLYGDFLDYDIISQQVFFAGDSSVPTGPKNVYKAKISAKKNKVTKLVDVKVLSITGPISMTDEQSPSSI